MNAKKHKTEVIKDQWRVIYMHALLKLFFVKIRKIASLGETKITVISLCSTYEEPPTTYFFEKVFICIGRGQYRLDIE